MSKANKNKKRILAVFAAIFASGIVALFIIHYIVYHSYSDDIISANEAKTLSASPDCILILGAGVTDDGKPMPMLLERLNTGLSLYKEGASDKIIVSGDHGREGYDEVNVMKGWLIDNGVPSEDIFMDHAGFSTYESMYRARDIFQVETMLVVTQKYHLYRALYDANTLGVRAYGIPCDETTYPGQTYRQTREAAARVKDFFYCAFKARPKYLGAAIPVSGNGDSTNDN